MADRKRVIGWGVADRRAAVLASWGFSNAFIEGQTGLSAGQISYRLRRLGMQGVRRDYRNGAGDVAAELLRLRTRAAAANVDTRVTTLLGQKK